MPIENLYIARVTDGLVLVASMETPGSETGLQGDKMELYKNQAKQLLKKLHQGSTSRMSIETNPYIFHYVIESGVCYLALTDKNYPKRLAFLFLEEIAKDFVADLKIDHGEDWMRQVEVSQLCVCVPFPCPYMCPMSCVMYVICSIYSSYVLSPLSNTASSTYTHTNTHKHRRWDGNTLSSSLTERYRRSAGNTKTQPPQPTCAS